MGILSVISDLLWPKKCFGCDYPGDYLCSSCAEILPIINQEWACKICGAPFGYLTCTECDSEKMGDGSLSRNFSFGEFEQPLSRGIVVYKDYNERSLGSILGKLLANGYKQSAFLDVADAAADVVTWVPPTKAAYARRGYDHAGLLAKAFAEELCLPAAISLLSRDKADDQRTLGRAGRAKNVKGTFRVVGEVEGSVLVIDDVFTTGATMQEVAAVLMSAGAKQVSSVTLARVW